MSRNLAVRTFDEVAEISVLDGAFERVAHEVGELDAKLSEGLYVVRVRVGPTVTERLVALDRDRIVTFDKEFFPSAVPFIGASSSSAWHVKVAENVSAMPRDDLGHGGTVMVFVRDRARKHDPGSGIDPIRETDLNPAVGLSIRRGDDLNEERIDIAARAEVLTEGDACAGWSATVSPGPWLLTSRNADGSETERAVWVGQGNHVQVFLLRLEYALADGKSARLVDLGGGAVVISPIQYFRANDAHTRLADLACYALTQGRHVLSRRMLEQIQSEKFDDAMLGLIGACLLIRDRPDDRTSLRTALGNLRRILGEDNPDLLALTLRSQGIEHPTMRLRYPPMLRAGWDAVVEASSQIPYSIVDGSPAAAMASRVLPGAPWLIWDSGSTDADRDLLLTQIVDEFVQARAKTSVSRPATAELSLPRKGRARRGRTRVGSQSLVPTELIQAKVAPKSTSKSGFASNLPIEERGELARALGVPSGVLAELLSRLTN